MRILIVLITTLLAAMTSYAAIDCTKQFTNENVRTDCERLKKAVEQSLEERSENIAKRVAEKHGVAAPPSSEEQPEVVTPSFTTEPAHTPEAAPQVPSSSGNSGVKYY